MPTTLMEYMTQKSNLKTEATGIERLIEYVKTLFDPLVLMQTTKV